MSATAIELPKVDGVTIELVPPQTLKLGGTITKREPGEHLSGFLKAVHRDAVSRQLKEFRVDVSDLTFVNSSSIRLFIDWAVWVKSEPVVNYKLRFVTSRKVTWQQTAFSALSSLMSEVVIVERI
jgi:hypothetical protein